MQYKTSSSHFEKYGTVYNQSMKLEKSDLVCHEAEISAKESISMFYTFDSEIYIEVKSGMASLIVSETPDAETFEVFAIHRNVKLKPHIYFQISSVSSTSAYRLITKERHLPEPTLVAPPYYVQRVLPRIRVKEILGYYYAVRDSGYTFQGESHPYYELTYVDRGTLVTEVDGTAYELTDRDLIIYGPNQFHTQKIRVGSSCSYITILFELEPETDHFHTLLNRTFSYSKKIHHLMKSLVNESSSFTPYMDSMILCLLQEIIIRLLQSDYIPPETKEETLLSEVRQNQHDELLDKVLAYIDDTICEPITIGEICEKFSVSRSTLQFLFNENLHQTPRKYISNLKMEKSRQLINEDRYTFSEIALMMGFNSIHYFSRAFTAKYKMTPTEYAKTLFKS